MVTNQAVLFLIFIVNGILIGLFFDLFRILRRTFKTSDMATYIEDFLFWVLTGFSILYTIFAFNNGEIRLFMFLAIFIGITFYMLTCSAFVIKVNVIIINFFKKIILSILNIIKLPFTFIFKIIKKLFFKPVSFVIINVRKNFTNLFNNISKTTKNNKNQKLI